MSWNQLLCGYHYCDTTSPDQSDVKDMTDANPELIARISSDLKEGIVELLDSNETEECLIAETLSKPSH